MTLEEARAKQIEILESNFTLEISGGFVLNAHYKLTRIGSLAPSSLEADYALLAATQAAIYSQTVKCPECNGACEVNNAYKPYWATCPTCNGRGRVPK